MHGLGVSGDSASSSDSARRPSLWLLVACFIGCSLTAGIIPGQTIFTEFFVTAGIFGDICSNKQKDLGCDEQYLEIGILLNFAGVIVPVAGLIIGDAFDRWGGKVCAVVGSMMVAVAFALIASIVMVLPFLSGQNTFLSYAIVCLVFVADIGATLNSFALLGLIWHYPRNQSLISSLLNASYQAAAFFAVGIQYISHVYSVGLAIPLFGWSIVQALLCAWFWKHIPSKSEYESQAKLVLGIPLQISDKHDLCRKMKLACTILWVDLTAHCMLALSFVCGLTMASYYQAIAIPFSSALFESKEAGTKFGAMCTFLTGACGLIVVPLVGCLADRHGLGVVVAAQVLFPAVFCITCTLNSWTFATVAAASLSSYYCVCYLLVSRWFLYFSPPNRVGMVISVFQALIAAVVYVCCRFLANLTSSMQDVPINEYKNQISTTLLTSSFISAIAGASFALYYFVARPCPQLPRLLP